MSIEAKVQTDLVKYLRRKGCYVIKTGGAGTPVGCPDVIALLEGLWLAFEIKANEKSPYGPLQEDTIRKLSDWSFCSVVHSGNFEEVLGMLEAIL